MLSHILQTGSCLLSKNNEYIQGNVYGYTIIFSLCISFILFNELSRFLDEIETAIITVSNNEIITLDLTVSKKQGFRETSPLFVD